MWHRGPAFLTLPSEEHCSCTERAPFLLSEPFELSSCLLCFSVAELWKSYRDPSPQVTWEDSDFQSYVLEGLDRLDFCSFFSGTRLLCFRESSFTSTLSAWVLLLLGWMPGRNRLEQGPFILAYEFPRFGPQPPPLLGICCERCSDGVVHESIVGKQTEGRRSGVETLPSLPLLELGYICSVQYLQKSVTRWRPSTQHTSLFIVTCFAEAVLPCALWDAKYEPFISGISAAQCLFLWSANIGLITTLLCCCLWWSRRCGRCNVVLITCLQAAQAVLEVLCVQGGVWRHDLLGRVLTFFEQTEGDAVC